MIECRLNRVLLSETILVRVRSGRDKYSSYRSVSTQHYLGSMLLALSYQLSRLALPDTRSELCVDGEIRDIVSALIPRL